MSFRKSVCNLVSALMVLALPTGAALAQEFPQPKPEHNWLQQFTGEWEAETEAYMEPGKPPVHMQGTESIRPLGGFWTVSEINSSMMNQPFTGNLTLGYDVDKQKYVGTWVDSMTGHLWNYEGTVDPSGKALTLETEGACPMKPGKISKFREVLELKDKDHKVFTSSIQGDDGKWNTMMVSRAHRKH